MTDLYRNRTLALAGIVQAAALADELAWKGQCHNEAKHASLDSILVMDTDDASVIYGGPKGLELGLRSLEDSIIKGGHQKDVVRYVMALMHIERKLANQPDLLKKMRYRLEEAEAQRKHYGDITDPGMVSNLAQTYVETVSTLNFRIQVKGNAQHLQTSGMAENIRAVLLSGVRAAWLWNRMGGRRWHLLFTRDKILREIQEIIKSQNNTNT